MVNSIRFEDDDDRGYGVDNRRSRNPSSDTRRPRAVSETRRHSRGPSEHRRQHSETRQPREARRRDTYRQPSESRRRHSRAPSEARRARSVSRRRSSGGSEYRRPSTHGGPSIDSEWLEKGDDQSGLDDSNLPVYDDEEVRGILRRVDWRLLPALGVLYFFAYLDRAAISYAKIVGMTSDLNMHGHDYNIAVTCFYIPHALFMIPTNAAIVKKVRPSWWFTIMAICWGISMTMHGVVQTWGQLCAVRALLGLFQAGFVPATDYVLTCWYARYEITSRTAIFLVSSTFASSVSGLLGYAIENMGGVGGRAAWRWIFILEGLATVLVCSTIWLWMPDSPTRCDFLSDREQDIVERRLIEDTGHPDGFIDTEDSFSFSLIWNSVTDWRNWLWSFCLIGDAIPATGFSSYAPTIVKGLGYSTWEAQLLIAPIYALAVVLSIWLAFAADKQRTRWNFTVFPFIATIIAFIILLAIPHPQMPGLTYGFLFLIPTGLTCARVTIVSWVGNNLAPAFRRSVGIGFVLAMSNIGGIIGSNIYIDSQSPSYRIGYACSLAALVVAVICALTLKVLLSKINELRDQTDADEVMSTYTQEELSQLGDRSPFWRYVV